MPDLPERLVVIAAFHRPETARQAVNALQAAGIYSETGSGFHKGRSDQEVRVLEIDAREAKEVLDPLLEEESGKDALVCPRCGSRRAAPRPAAGLYALVTGLIVAIALALMKLPTWTSIVVFVAGIAAAPLLEKLVGRWRCESCGNIWVSATPPG